MTKENSDMISIRFALSSLAVTALFTGCSLVASVDRDAIPPDASGGSGGDSAGGGTPGSGGTTSSSGGQGGTAAGGSGGAPATCSNSMLDGDETDVDCGGSCPGCSNGMACMDAVDCSSQYCLAMVCTACGGDGDCTPVAGTYCAVGSCIPKKAPGQGCAMGNECLSGNCADALCCDTLCDQPCESCKLSGTEGACTLIANMDDPDEECGGPQVCDGMGNCVPP
jgi:hypothetical protein